MVNEIDQSYVNLIQVFSTLWIILPWMFVCIYIYINLHKSSFKLEHKRTTTTLSDHIWKLKKKNTDYNIKWEIIKNVKPYAPGEKTCKLCLQEKLSILISKPSLNKRSEIFGHCVHRKQFLLNNIKEQYTPPASQQQQRKYSTNQQLSRLKKEPNQASKLLSHDNDDI